MVGGVLLLDVVDWLFVVGCGLFICGLLCVGCVCSLLLFVGVHALFAVVVFFLLCVSLVVVCGVCVG